MEDWYIYKLAMNVSAEVMLFFIYLYLQYYHNISPSDLNHTNLISEFAYFLSVYCTK